MAFLSQRLQVAAEEADDWGPRDEIIRKDWRTKKTGLYGIDIVGKVVALENETTQPATLKKFSNITPYSVNHAFDST